MKHRNKSSINPIGEPQNGNEEWSPNSWDCSNTTTKRWGMEGKKFKLRRKKNKKENFTLQWIREFGKKSPNNIYPLIYDSTVCFMNKFVAVKFSIFQPV